MDNLECYGKYSSIDVYCKECEFAVECYDDTVGVDRHDA